MGVDAVEENENPPRTVHRHPQWDIVGFWLQRLRWRRPTTAVNNRPIYIATAFNIPATGSITRAVTAPLIDITAYGGLAYGDGAGIHICTTKGNVGHQQHPAYCRNYFYFYGVFGGPHFSLSLVQMGLSEPCLF